MLFGCKDEQITQVCVTQTCVTDNLLFCFVKYSFYS